MYPLSAYIIKFNSNRCRQLANRDTTSITAAAWTKIVLDGLRDYQATRDGSFDLDTAGRLLIAAQVAGHFEAEAARERKANSAARADHAHVVRLAEDAQKARGMNLVGAEADEAEASRAFHGERINHRAQANRPW